MFIHVRHVRRHEDVKAAHETTHCASLTERRDTIHGVNWLNDWIKNSSRRRKTLRKAAIVQWGMQPSLIHFSRLHLPRGHRSGRSPGQHWHYATSGSTGIPVLNGIDEPGWFRCTRLTCWWTRMQSCELISERAKFHERGRPLTRFPYRLPKGSSGSNWSTLFFRQTSLSFEAQAFKFAACNNTKVLLILRWFHYMV